MGRKLLIVLLAAGTVLGFGLGFARHHGCHHGYGWGAHRHGPHALEERAADACVRAAERVMKERAGSDAQKPRETPPPAPPAAL